MAADWGNIPIELATEIVEHAELYEDFETFRFVSSHWRSAAKQAKFRGSVTVPWLLLPENDSSSTRRRLYSVNSHKIRHFELPSSTSLALNFQNECDTRILSSRGWLLCVSSQGENISLFNPLSDTSIELPMPAYYNRRSGGYGDGKLSTYKGLTTGVFKKFILSAKPSTTSNFTIAMVLAESYENRIVSWHKVIVFWRSNNNNQDNNQWVPPARHYSMPYDLRSRIFHNCHDICFYRGDFYATDDRGRILQFDLNHEIPQISITLDLKQYLSKSYSCYIYYLVDLDGRLLHVTRVTNLITSNVDGLCSTYSTTSFEILELNLDDGTATRIHDLGTRAIFVGSNSSSFSVEAASTCGCKPNCIYYTDEARFNTGLWGGGKDISVYNLANRKIDSFYEGTPHFNEYTPLMWIESPNPEF